MRVVSVLVPLLLGLMPVPAGADNNRADHGPDLAVVSSDRPLVVESDRAAIADYYRSEYRAGHCPDGLVRTEQGCARKPLWTLGAPLDPSVTIETLPAGLLAQMRPAPEGCRYIRIGDRVLLMDARSRVIQAELLDLGRVGFGRVTPRLRLSAGSGASR